MPKISFIIVNYNNFSLLRSVVDHLLVASPVPFEILIVDNASTDGDVRNVLPVIESVKVIQNRSNEGWPSAINAGIARSQGDYICIVDNDVHIHDNTIQTFLNISISKGDRVIIAPVLRNADGSIQRSFRDFPILRNRFHLLFFLNIAFPRSPRCNPEHWNYISADVDHEVDDAMGACLFMHRSVIDRNGLFDDTFFMYSSDTDFCYRHKRSGGSIIRTPHVRVTHFGSVSSRKTPYLSMKYFARDLSRYYHKHYSPVTTCWILALEMIIAAERALIWFVAGLLTARKLWIRRSLTLWVKSGFVASELFLIWRTN